MGVTNLFQSWVPFGTTFKIRSAAIIPPSHEGKVLLIVVRNIEPPGFKELIQHYKKQIYGFFHINFFNIKFILKFI